MSRLVLSVNAGSSSLKVSVFGPTFEGPKHLASVTIQSISAPDTTISSTIEDINSKEQDMTAVKDHDSALNHILEILFRTTTSQEDITHVCHRVVHGGNYEQRLLVDSTILHQLEELTELAPLHNASAVALIKSCMQKLPQTKSIAFFDTIFHRTIPAHIYTFPIDPQLAKNYSLRKYGFHGISYSFILRNVAEFLNKPQVATNLIVLHLGAGASACCIKNGQSLDTSMSLTPTDGLPGATRSGSIDPNAILHYMRKTGSSVEDAENILNSKSGWKALTGTTSFADIASSSNENHELAFDILVDRILTYVGSYFLKLNGQVDALVFAGGIGEKSDRLREVIAERCSCFGFKLAKGSSNQAGIVRKIGEGKPSLLVCETDEQLEMARHCTFDKELYDRGEL